MAGFPRQRSWSKDSRAQAQNEGVQFAHTKHHSFRPTIVVRRIDYARLTTAVEQALDLGCADVAAIRHLLLSDQLQHAVGEAIEIGALAAYERPLPSMIEYDRLFSSNVQAVQA